MEQVPNTRTPRNSKQDIDAELAEHGLTFTAEGLQVTRPAWMTDTAWHRYRDEMTAWWRSCTAAGLVASAAAHGPAVGAGGNYRASVGAAVRAAMSGCGVTVAVLAERLCLKPDHAGDLLAGRSPFTVDQLKVVADMLEVSVSSLLPAHLPASL